MANPLVTLLGLLGIGLGDPAVTIALVAFSLVVAAGFCVLAYSTYHRVLRLLFWRGFGIALSSDVVVRLRLGDRSTNYYRLTFPHWRFANDDGTELEGPRGNGIEWGPCDLHVGSFHVLGTDPALMVWLVNALRRREVKIARTSLEVRKYRDAAAAAKLADDEQVPEPLWRLTLDDLRAKYPPDFPPQEIEL